MKILVFGHWSDTGFGVVTQELSRRWVIFGHDVRVIAVNHRGGPIADPLMATRVWPANIKGDPYGGNISHEAVTGEFWSSANPYDQWKPDAVLMVGDTGSVTQYLGVPREEGDLFGPFGKVVPTWNYCPIEGPNLRPSWKSIWENLQPVAMSQYGADTIHELTGGEVPMIYHGVDSDIFRPINANHPLDLGPEVLQSKEHAKKFFGLEGRFIVFRADRLVDRKQYHILIQSMVPVFEAHDNVDLLIHCKPVDDGHNLFEEVARLPSHLWPRVRFTNAHDTWSGMPREMLAILYNAADIYVSPTGGEGFGLTLAEASACGVPVVTTDFAAGTEVVAEGGILVPPVKDLLGETILIRSRYGMDWCLSDEAAFSAAIMRLVDSPQERSELGRLGRLHVRRFSWETSAMQFITLFERGIATKAA